MNTDDQTTKGGVLPPGAASPRVAAAFLAGIVYVWAEALYRYLLTNTPVFNNVVLWNARDGHIAAMWLIITVLGLLAFYVFGYGILKKRTYVRTLWFWTIVLTASAIVAPFLGEIGTPFGL